MLSKRSIRAFVGALAMALAMVGVQFAAQSPAAADPSVQARTVYYTAYAYSSQSSQAASIWNSAAPNVRMVSSSNGSIRIYGTTGGGSRAYVCGLGCATIYIDSRDIAAGHNALRIVAHEIGHGLGLPDTYNGICSYLMSGGSAGTSCSNPYPNAGEASRVNNLFRSALTSQVGPFVSDVYDPSLVRATV
ncbi:snapalysin family zinc-dependent metalloprotease [Phytomonospora sp. NPDC050363]|uniref:snapalysin family zinc-dependent metalloprotease n=1 Tax=Phytomonospora sp. NPDC050363 TaxID=3155642 RepID=UPI0033F1E8B4